MDVALLSFQTRSVSGLAEVAMPLNRHSDAFCSVRFAAGSFPIERKAMPNSANSSNYVPDNISSHGKPPASESLPWPPNSIEPSSPLGLSPSPQSSSGPQSMPPRMIDFPAQERLLNAREVASRLGVSERWVRDHTTRRSPKIRGVKLGTLMRYRRVDVEEFMEKLMTSRSSLQPRFGG